MKPRIFTASKIVTYRMSNATVRVTFSSLKDAVAHVNSELKLHPRSKKFDRIILIDGEYANSFNAFNYEFYRDVLKNKFDGDLKTPSRRVRIVAEIKKIGLKISDFK